MFRTLVFILRELTKSSSSRKDVIRFAPLKGPLTFLWRLDRQRTRLDDDRVFGAIAAIQMGDDESVDGT